MSSKQHDKGANGSVLLVDSATLAAQADPIPANSGFSIYLLARFSVSGRKMALLVNTLPTNKCTASMISPDLVGVGRIHHTCLSACEETKYAAGRERYSRARIPQTHGYAHLIVVA